MTNKEMTNKEAADILRLMPKQSDAIKKAIEVLESENYYKSLAESYGETINKLTTAISETKHEPRKGHWIMTSNYYTGAYGTIDYVKCSCCSEESLEEGDFCPNCGAEMESK